MTAPTDHMTPILITSHEFVPTRDIVLAAGSLVPRDSGGFVVRVPPEVRVVWPTGATIFTNRGDGCCHHCGSSIAEHLAGQVFACPADHFFRGSDPNNLKAPASPDGSTGREPSLQWGDAARPLVDVLAEIRSKGGQATKP